jgi:glycine betaine catabolism A
MVDVACMRAALAERRSGFSLPQALYLNPEIYQADLDAIFANEWIFACNGCEIPQSGDFQTLEVGRDSVIVLRDRDGQVRAYHNTCRHRGSRICTAESGRATRLTCPYHQWVYDLDGTLRHARQMPRDFDRRGHALAPVAAEVICGMVYICLAEAPPDLSRFRAAVTPYIAPHRPDRVKVAHQTTLVEEANWKLVIENNRECYHCAGNHPELLATLVEFALPDDTAGTAQFQTLIARKAAAWDAQNLPHMPVDGGVEFRCIRLPFHEGAVSFTRDGGPACRKLVGDLTDRDLGSVRMFRAPNNWNHFLADHIIHFRILPLDVNRTVLRTTWLVHEDAVEGVDYDVQRLTEVWEATNRQDADLGMLNHQGIGSRAYRPGPYAPSEFMLKDFTDWYADKLARHYDIAPGLNVAA